MAQSASADPLVITGGILRYLLDEPARLQASFLNGSVDIEWADEIDGGTPEYTCCYHPGIK